MDCVCVCGGGGGRAPGTAAQTLTRPLADTLSQTSTPALTPTPQASQHEEALARGGGGGLFASCSPLLGGPAPDQPAAPGSTNPAGTEAERDGPGRGPDQSPQHKRRATPGSVGAAAAASPGRKGGPRAPPPLSELQQEQVLLAEQQAAEQRRQAQLAAWAAAVAAGPDGGGGAAAAAAEGQEEEVEEEEEERCDAMQSTGRVLFS